MANHIMGVWSQRCSIPCALWSKSDCIYQARPPPVYKAGPLLNPPIGKLCACMYLFTFKYTISWVHTLNYTSPFSHPTQKPGHLIYVWRCRRPSTRTDSCGGWMGHTLDLPSKIHVPLLANRVRVICFFKLCYIITSLTLCKWQPS